MKGGAQNQRPDPSHQRRREAGAAFERGWLLTPLAGKKPFVKEWSKAPPPTREDVERWAGERNIGVRTGVASGVVVIDVDRDDPNVAVQLGLPTTATVRTSRGRHYYLAHPGGTIKNSSSVLGKGIDVKADGGCVVLPGSVHPDTGHSYAWEPGLSPDDVPIAPISPELLERLRPTREQRRPPATSKTKRLSPDEFAHQKLEMAAQIVATAPDGTRNDTLNRQAFLLKRLVDAKHLNWNEVVEALGEAALGAGLDRSEIDSTLESAARSGPVHLGVICGDSSYRPSGDRPTIEVVPGGLLEVLAQSEDALLAMPDSPIYQRGGALFRLIPDHAVLRSTTLKNVPLAYALHPVDADWLVLEFMSCARYERFDKKSDELVPIDCPLKIARSYISRAGEWKVPILNSIVQTPTFRIDGSLLEKPGYDPASRLLFLPGGTSFDPVPEAPTRKDAKAAIRILVEPISQFPFADAADRSVALSAMLTSIIRRSLPSAPAFAFRAPTMGSGKSLLTDVIAILMTGRVARPFSLGNQVEEEKKTIFAALLSGSPILALDNVDRAIGSAVMCSILTQEVWQGRVLGYSKNVAVPTDVLTIVNGNNLQFEGDIVTRVLPCDLDPECERPEERSFVGDLRARVSELRPQLVLAALTVMRAYIAAGKPKLGLTPFGRFEAWSDLVRAALVWAGEPDPCLTRKRLQEDDPVTERLGRVLQAWHEAYGSAAKLVAELAVESGPTVPESLRDVLLEVAGDAAGQINRKKLGQYLATFKHRWIDGLRFERDGTRGHATRWRVVKKVQLPGARVEFEEFQESNPSHPENLATKPDLMDGESSESALAVFDSSNSSNSTEVSAHTHSGRTVADFLAEHSRSVLAGFNSSNSSNSSSDVDGSDSSEFLADPEATQ